MEVKPLRTCRSMKCGLINCRSNGTRPQRRRPQRIWWNLINLEMEKIPAILFATDGILITTRLICMIINLGVTFARISACELGAIILAMKLKRVIDIIDIIHFKLKRIIDIIDTIPFKCAECRRCCQFLLTSFSQVNYRLKLIIPDNIEIFHLELKWSDESTWEIITSFDNYLLKNCFFSS